MPQADILFQKTFIKLFGIATKWVKIKLFLDKHQNFSITAECIAYCESLTLNPNKNFYDPVVENNRSGRNGLNAENLNEGLYMLDNPWHLKVPALLKTFPP